MFYISVFLYSQQVNIGISGQVIDADTQKGISGAVISVEGIKHNVTSNEGGYFWRLLVHGDYTITVSAEG